MKKNDVDKGRRKFLKLGIFAGAGLILGGYATTGGEKVKNTSEVWNDAPDGLTPDAWLRVGPDGEVTVRVNHTEMGQGITTAFAMIVAEELEADWTRVRAEIAPAESVYKNPAFNCQMTAGSTSVSSSWDILRKAGAAAREMLLEAAAATWGVSKGSCRARQGKIIHQPTGRTLDYGELAARAAGLTIPENPRLKPPGEYKIIGKNMRRLDGESKTTGEAVFGLDVRLPGMLRATVIHPPVFGAGIRSIHGKRARKIPGVKDIIPLENGVAVVAETTWQAFEGARALLIKWEREEDPRMDSEFLYGKWPELIEKEGKEVYTLGDAGSSMARASRTLKGSYLVPYQAHATPEPMNCTASVKKDRCEVWAPTQNQDAAKEAASRICGLPYVKVGIITPFVGGGFGRRVEVDYVTEAVTLSKKLGRPVQVVWTREEDMQNDCYRPATYNELQAGLDQEGLPIAWVHRIVGQDHMARMLPRLFPSMLPYAVPRTPRNLASSFVSSLLPGIIAGKKAVEGAAPLPYGISNIRVDFFEDNPGIPTGFWRSVAYSQNCFLVESFLDEIAEATGKDPIDLRLRLLRDNPPMKKVLELVVEKSDWGKQTLERTYQGVAIQDFHHTLLALVADVSIGENRELKVRRVVCAVDCGVAINPKNIESQIRGGIVFGLTATLKGAITLKRGRVVESNFDDFPLLRMDEAPNVEVHIVPSGRHPTGIGEAAVPLIAPAVCNAVFAGTGIRIRRLPIDPSQIRLG
jgi:CO/xanthine dehydrogenase Mo-binding subunit